ncbi:MAG: AbrB/MazE/SpoVT family DNA-binding domain-containing protein [Bacillota bacterium]
MKTTVQKWGNSLALRIPNAFASEMDLRPGSPVTLSIDGDRLVIRQAPRTLTLKELLSKVTKDNIHREVQFGGPVGKETW